MSDASESRTLVKSAPELWAECSDPEALSRHLTDVGELRVTELEPETTVAWEGAATRGTVRLEPSGWGTRVTLTTSDPDGAAPLERALDSLGRAHHRPEVAAGGGSIAQQERDLTP